MGTAVSKFADLTPYLAGDKITKYPNLANIPTSAWQSGVWNGKLYGIPSFPSPNAFPGYLFYRKDLFEAAGIPPEVKTADDLFAAGKELTDAERRPVGVRRPVAVPAVPVPRRRARGTPTPAASWSTSTRHRASSRR